MFSREIAYFAIVLLEIGFLSNSVNSQDVVRLRTCCELNIKGGQTKCSSKSESSTASGIVGTWTVPANLMSTNKTKIFELTSEKLKCNGGKGNITTFPANIPRPAGLAALPITFHPSGYLLISESPFAGEFYHTSQYCINGISDKEIEVQTCVRHCSPQEPCINKCCSPDTVYSRLNPDPGVERCVDPGPIKWTPRLFSTPKKQLSEVELKKLQPWYSLRQPPSWLQNCINHTLHFLIFDEDIAKILHATDSIRHRFRTDGEILVWNKMARRWEVSPKTENYCADGVLYQPDKSYEHKEEETFIMTCPIPFQPRKERDASLYYGIFASITCVFALITVIVYALLWEKQNVHGWTIMSHSTSVFFFFVFIATAHLTKNNTGTHKTSAGCLVLATLAHYFFLSTFCWLTMISFDLWLTFRSISLSKGKGLKRFLGYSVFGWGVPLFIVGLSWTLELIYKDDDNSEVVIPMYGVKMCYLTTYAYWEYIYAPCTILMSLNLIFFVMTTWKLYEFKKSTRFATKSVQRDRQSYLLFLKLFFVVGVLWIFEIISWAVDQTDITWYWQVLDSLNCLSPVAIFIIFVFKYDVLNSLGSKYPVMKTLCCPNMWILGQIRRQQTRGTDESAALNMSKTHNDTTTSKVSESSMADR